MHCCVRSRKLPVQTVSTCSCSLRLDSGYNYPLSRYWREAGSENETEVAQQYRAQGGVSIMKALEKLANRCPAGGLITTACLMEAAGRAQLPFHISLLPFI